eukprot:TRINITY_DN2699_c0_g1_i1.p1 TRINITY_DN2699_c0_g1~~TRINITY_DN2699_c0_g1_i1.p1  ORF type:complete len:111 (-),score=2.75 TRINITY_DN2699_c0_g1_i1:315-647(-)
MSGQDEGNTDSWRYDAHARRVNDTAECGVGKVLFGNDQRGRSGKRIMKIQGHLPAYLFSVAEALICLVIVFFFLASVPLTFRRFEPAVPDLRDLQTVSVLPPTVSSYSSL